MKSMTYTEKQEKVMADEIWLMYFNDYLYKREVISYKQYCAMIGKIICCTEERKRKLGIR